MKIRRLIYFIVIFLGLISFVTFATKLSYKLHTDSIETDSQGELNPTNSKVFDGLYANFTFEFLEASNNSFFKYSHVGGNYYNVTWTIQGSGSNSWIENSQNRITSNSSGYYSYGDGRHTPLWIFTNISIGNFTLIAVNGFFNHLFEVTNELSHDYPGIGIVEVWVLQDLGRHYGIAWYEKNTGILLNGTFSWARGSYKLTLTSTNIFSFYQEKVKLIPWYNYVILISFVSVITITIAKKIRAI